MAILTFIQTRQTIVVSVDRITPRHLIDLHKDVWRKIWTLFKSLTLLICEKAKCEFCTVTRIFYCGFAAHWKRSHNIVQKRPFTVTKRSLVNSFSVWSAQTHLLSSSAVGSRSRSHGVKYNFETSLFFFTCDSLNFTYQKLSQNCLKNKPILYPTESVLGFLVGASTVALTICWEWLMSLWSFSALLKYVGRTETHIT